ncbi:MAG: alpha/beta fold hydrolase [Acidimicrobiia bacterium]|nr:alpha/beta fold hydrolase [Acidimicrobiia bacterium]
MTEQMRVTTDDGVGLAVEVTGTGAPLVMIHGFTGVKDDFSDHLDVFAHDSTVVTFDLRGHGESDKPESGDAYSFDRLAADTFAVADALGLEHFRLFGHSLGGMVARRVVLGAPSRIDALVLMSTSAGRPSGVDPELVDVGVAVALTEGMQVVRQVLDELDPLGTFANQRVRLERPDYEDYGRRNFFNVPAVAYAALISDIAYQPDQLAEMRDVTCPTLVIVGEQDNAFLPDSLALADVIPGAELVVVPDAGHSPQFENPPVYQAAMERFLGRVTATARGEVAT